MDQAKDYCRNRFLRNFRLNNFNAISEVTIDNIEGSGVSDRMYYTSACGRTILNYAFEDKMFFSENSKDGYLTDLGYIETVKKEDNTIAYRCSISFTIIYN